jgi:DNA invertase Pin-like site-specific DNA recombinase
MLTAEKQTQQVQSDPAPFKNRKIIATELGISVKTLSRWLKKEGIELPNGLLSPHFQVVIYQKCLAKGPLSDNVHPCPILSTPSNLL